MSSSQQQQGLFTLIHDGSVDRAVSDAIRQAHSEGKPLTWVSGLLVVSDQMLTINSVSRCHTGVGTGAGNQRCRR